MMASVVLEMALTGIALNDFDDVSNFRNSLISTSLSVI